jgi:hypothetical protein
MLAINERVADLPDLQGAFYVDTTRHERAVHEQIDAELHMVGLEHFSETTAQRMALIEVIAAQFNDDSRTIRRVCLKVIDRMANIVAPELRSALDADSKRDMSIAAYLHDIGKSGPLGASRGSQEATVKLYAVSNVADPDQTVTHTVHARFSPDDAETILEHLGRCGMRSTDTMRAFWDRHGYWTHDILEADSQAIPNRARLVAASHHMDRGIDPYGFTSDDYVVVLENRILMAVDKYQAAVARGHKTHCEAIDVVTRIHAPKYAHDATMNRVVEVLDALGKEEPLFEMAA